VYRVANWMAFSAFQWALSSGGETTVGTAAVCVAFDAIAQAISSASCVTRPGLAQHSGKRIDMRDGQSFRTI
jgi:hypothetical protein